MMNFSHASRLSTFFLSGAVLTACGGAATAPGTAPVVLATASTSSAATVSTLPATAPPPPDTTAAATAPPTTAVTTVASTAPPPPPPPSTLQPATGAVVTDVRFQNTSAQEQVRVPVTFGQVFAVGNVGPAQTLTGRLADGTSVPLQVDIKARHADGSLRHAIISASLTRLAASQSLAVNLEKIAAPAGPGIPATPAALLDAGFSASVNADINGQRYSASADALLRSGKYTSWLAGPVANEWLLSGPLTTAQGVAHPHLSARFAIRAYGTKQARVDVTIENAWAFEAAPQNFLYDAQIMVGGQSVYTKPALNHLTHARWRKVFWWGGEPAVHVKHNTAYLIASRAVANYDQSVTFSESRLAAWGAAWAGARIEPMGVGLANPYMLATGGRDDIGLMPGWTSTYLLSMDKRVKDVSLGTAELAGSWSAHYRDKNTDRPVSVVNFPYMTLLGTPGDTFNPQTKLREAFPPCATPTACPSPYAHDSSHQPGFAYLPYLVTGDYYYLEELQFWAMWNTFASNPEYRQLSKGLIVTDQTRGQAWSLRTLAEAAYISPDADPLKKQFESFVNNNLDWYNTNYTNGNNNQLGMLTHGYAVSDNNGLALPPWMDDFFTSAVGHTAELGFAKALPLLAWKAKFPILRMTGKDFCWIKGGLYALNVRETPTSPFFTTIGEVYKASNSPAENALACNSSAMAASLGLRVGEMTGYSDEHAGYPSNMQPALAYAADVGGSAGAAAWTVFMGRSVKPNYGDGPQFAIIPR